MKKQKPSKSDGPWQGYLPNMHYAVPTILMFWSTIR